MLWQMLCPEFKDWHVNFVFVKHVCVLLKGEGVTSRNAVGGVSFCVCLVLTVSTFRSGDWMSARSIIPVNVMTTTISEPIRHPRLL